MLITYLDESGNDGRSPVFLFGGYVATEEQWSAFDDAWQAELDREPKVRAFHMSEAWSKKVEPWGSMSAAERDDRVLRFAEIPRGRVLAGVLNGVPHTHVDCFASPRTRIPSEDPIYINLSLTLHVLSTECQQDMEVVFDEPSSKKARGRLSGAIDAVMSMHGESGFEFLDCIRGYSFADDKSTLPLQAADLLAWQWNRALRIRDNPKLIIGWNREALMELTTTPVFGKVAAHPSMPDPLPPASIRTEEQQQALRTIFTRG